MNVYDFKDSRYHLGEKVLTYYNTKVGTNGVLTAHFTEALIVNVYKNHRPTSNGKFQYALEYYNPVHCKTLTEYRFVHQIFKNEIECLKFIDFTNERRKIMREARNKLKESDYVI